MTESLVISSVIALGTMTPSAPAHLGSYEFFAVSPLEMFGIAPGAALALAIAMHSWIIISVVALGAFAWVAEGLNWRGVRLLSYPVSRPDAK